MREAIAAFNPGGSVSTVLSTPIDSIADVDSFQARFYMNIRGARLDRVGDYLINAPNDRCLVCDISQALEIELTRVFSPCVANHRGNALAAVAIKTRYRPFEKRWRYEFGRSGSSPVK